MKSETNVIVQPKMFILKEGADEAKFDEILQEIMEKADGFYYSDALSYDEKNFYTCWLDALNDFSWDADPNDPKQKEAAQRRTNMSLKLVNLMKDNENIPEDFRKKCADLMDEYVTEK